jgi:hypothetical protein
MKYVSKKIRDSDTNNMVQILSYRHYIINVTLGNHRRGAAAVDLCGPNLFTFRNYLAIIFTNKIIFEEYYLLGYDAV